VVPLEVATMLECAQPASRTTAKVASRLMSSRAPAGRARRPIPASRAAPR
jgi:hypothetical protein